MCMKRNHKKPLLVFVILLSLFFLPMAVAWMLFAQKDMWKTVNRGDLIQPPLPISTFRLLNPKNSKYSLMNQKRWFLLLYYPQNCDQECEKGLDNIRQIWLATGKDMDRVGRGIIT